ncbi:hypothetical protein AYI69_g505 [Smittium culicis]|uniref:Uncharacterized protein n=1 Tax=Smittium culicis TaxID=133412 RepID=A0A1R1YST8_9FUNG|nr:hypothetical protein AYI69_g505 [Smittium culicis]
MVGNKGILLVLGIICKDLGIPFCPQLIKSTASDLSVLQNDTTVLNFLRQIPTVLVSVLLSLNLAGKISVLIISQ